MNIHYIKASEIVSISLRNIRTYEVLKCVGDFCLFRHPGNKIYYFFKKEDLESKKNFVSPVGYILKDKNICAVNESFEDNRVVSDIIRLALKELDYN